MAFSGLFKGIHKIRNRINIFHKFSPYENNLQYNVVKIKEKLTRFYIFWYTKKGDRNECNTMEQ